MTDYQNIRYSVSNSVATIALDNPQALNGFKQQMRVELIDAVKRSEEDDDVRVVILTGHGRAFSAGADLNEGSVGYDSFVEQCKAEYTPWLMGIHDSKKIYIAAVNGVAAGIGSAAVMNCDLVVMAEDAYIYQAFAAIGLMPDGGATWLLLQKLGYQKAFELVATAGKINAQECQQIGLANKVVPADQLMEQTQKWAEKLAQGSPLSQAATKKLMRQVSSMTYKEVIETESVMQTELSMTEDHRDARAAFLSKQPIVFKGK